MTMKKTTKKSINDILNECDFSNEETKGFNDCIKAVKKEQKDGNINAEDEIKKIIMEVVKDEI